MRNPLLAAVALTLAACGGGGDGASTTTTTIPAVTTTTTVAPAEPLLQADLIGGCFMMGPNCARYVVSSDGTVEAYRLGEDVPELLWTSSIDPSLVDDLEEAVADTDLEAMRGRLGPGTCHACVDGIDTVLTFHTADGEIVFDSAQVEFDTTEPVFVTAALVVQAATTTGEVPIVGR